MSFLKGYKFKKTLYLKTTKTTSRKGGSCFFIDDLSKKRVSLKLSITNFIFLLRGVKSISYTCIGPFTQNIKEDKIIFESTKS